MKLNKKKVLAGLAALALMTTMFAGCAKTEQPTPEPSKPGTEDKTPEDNKPEEEIELSVAFWTDEKESMDDIKAAFEAEHSNVTLDLMEFPSEEYIDKLVIQLAGGANIDVMKFKNTAEYADVASKDQLLDINNLVAEDNLDVTAYGPLFEGLKMDGELFGMPYRKTVTVLYYNKDLFDAAGIDYPTDDMTWDEFRTLAKSMTTDKIAGAYLHTWPQIWYGYGLQKGASIIDEDLTPFEEALQLRLDLEADGSVMKFIDAKATNAHYKTEFAKGQTAMNIIGDFHIGQLRELEADGEIDFDWDIVAIPHPEGVEANTTFGTANPIGVAKETKNQEMAWELVKFISGEEGAKIYADNGRLPAYGNDEIQKIYAGEEGQKPANVGILTEAKVYLENPTLLGVGVIKDEIYGREAELSFIGERSVADTFKVIKEKMAEVLQ